MWGRTGGSVSLGYGRPSQERELEEERKEEIKEERGRGREGGGGEGEASDQVQGKHFMMCCRWHMTGM